MGGALHDIENVDAFCSGVLEIVVARNGSFLRPDQREEFHRFLVEATVVLAFRFTPGKPDFKVQAASLLQRRSTDWYRRELGDSRAKTRRKPLVSLDALIEDDVPLDAFSVPSFDEDLLTRVAVNG